MRAKISLWYWVFLLINTATSSLHLFRSFYSCVLTCLFFFFLFNKGLTHQLLYLLKESQFLLPLGTVFFFFPLFLKIFIYFNWSIIDLQCFRCTAKWFSYTYICVYIFPFRFFSIIGYYKILNIVSLCYTVGPCWLSVLYMVVCIF